MPRPLATVAALTHLLGVGLLGQLGLVLAAALGVLGSPWLVTVPLLGTLARTFDGGGAPVFRSPRAAMSLVLGGLAFGTLAWLPWVEGSMARGVFCVAAFPLSYVPLYLADATRSTWAAIVASVDRTLRATVADHARSAALVGFMAYGPTTYDRATHGSEPLPVLAVVVLLGAGITVASLRVMTRRVRRESVAHSRAGIFGSVVVGAMLLSPLATIVLFHAAVRPHYGPSPRYLLLPASVQHVPDAGWLVVPVRLRMGRAPWDRSGSFFFTETGGDALLVRWADDGPALQRVARGTLRPIAPSSAGSMMLGQFFVLGALAVALIMLLRWVLKRTSASARLFGAARTTRARVRRADVDIGIDEASIAQGASLELDHGTVVVLTRTLAVRGVPIDLDSTELPPRLDVTILSSLAWSTRESYRDAPALPADARGWWGHGVELIERDRRATLDVFLRAAFASTLAATLLLALIV